MSNAPSCAGQKRVCCEYLQMKMICIHMLTSKTLLAPHLKFVPFIFISAPLFLSQVNVERRLFIFRFGDPRARMNWVHVDNLVLAHMLAAEALTEQRSYVSVSHYIT